jgi:hypothetical protein
MGKRPSRAEQVFTITAMLLALIVVSAAGVSFYRYRTFALLSEAGARYAAVHGSVSDPQYVRPYGTAEALRSYLAERHPGETLSVTVSPADPNTLPPGALVTVTVAGPWVGSERLSRLVNVYLRASATARILQ